MADVLVIDDEENIAFSLQLALQRAGHDVRTAGSVAEGRAAAGEKPPEVAIVDVQLPDGDGLELVEALRTDHPDLGIVVVTAFGSVARAVEAMKRGANDFLQKPLSMEEVGLTVQRCVENRKLRSRLDAFADNQRRAAVDVVFVGEAPRIRSVLETAGRIAALDEAPGGGLLSVLILGETGTGKEVLARTLHALSSRADRPFVHVNCTAIPETLFESELFGHERGTFTDARQARRGLFEIADEGTLFLDEIGDLPTAMQAKLLVAIEQGRFRRLGGSRELKVDVRLIAATNADLGARVASGEFRRDLYYRLQVFELGLPPLRERGNDVCLLADHFIQAACRKLRRPPPALSEDARAALRRYAWPGNVRELAHTLQRAVLLNGESRLSADALGLPASAARADALTPDWSALTHGMTLADVERQTIVVALEACGGNVSEAARRLGLSRGGLRHRLQRFGIEAEIADPAGLADEGADD